MTNAADGRWQPSIGDPTAMGWIIVGAYGLAFVLCGWCAWRSAPRPERRFWGVMAVVMLLLGINKQLDLQTWLTQFGRDWALAGGWYESRRVIQALFIFWLGMGVLGLKAWLGLRLQALQKPTRLAGMGLLLLGAFVLMRAASFHHVDAMLGVHFANVQLHTVFELGGLAVIVYAAWRYVRAPRPAPR
jgi:hypothetical protein